MNPNFSWKGKSKEEQSAVNKIHQWRILYMHGLRRLINANESTQKLKKHTVGGGRLQTEIKAEIRCLDILFIVFKFEKH